MEKHATFSVCHFGEESGLLKAVLIKLYIVFKCKYCQKTTFTRCGPEVLLTNFAIFKEIPGRSYDPLLTTIAFIDFNIFYFLPLVLSLYRRSTVGGDEDRMRKRVTIACEGVCRSVRKRTE